MDIYQINKSNNESHQEDAKNKILDDSLDSKNDELLEITRSDCSDEDQLIENESKSSTDQNIEVINQVEINLNENKENVINKFKISNLAHNDSCRSFNGNNLSNLDRSVDRSKASIDDLSFSQKTLIKSCSLRSLITELVNDEILIDKNELSKDLNECEKEKFFLIIKTIKQDDCDRKVEQLKELCVTERGLILSDLRRIIWPIITNSHHLHLNHQLDNKMITNHPMYNQVIQDVNRTIKRFPPSIEKEERLSKEKQLTDLIMRILIENPNFHYYQGYHDICITFLLLLGEEKAFHVVNKISNTHLRQFMEETMDSTQLMLEMIPILIEKEDKELSNFLDKTEVGTIFSLSWVLTWFSHILVNNRNVERLFDFFIASDFRLPVYFTVCILLHNRDVILATEPDIAIVFQCLMGLLENEDKFPFELLLMQALDLFDKHSPETLLEEQKYRISLQKKHEKEQRSLHTHLEKEKRNELLYVIKKNKIILTASLIVAIGAITFQIYKN